MSNLDSAIDARLDHPNQRYQRSRSEAAEIISKIINTPFSPEKLRKTATPYATILGRVRYRDEDLIALARSILSAARKIGQPLDEAPDEEAA